MSFKLSYSQGRLLAQAETRPKGSIVSFSQPKLVQFRRHDNLQGRDGLWRIHSGYVRSLTWSPTGDFVPLGFWSKGDIVGDAILQRSGLATSQIHHCQTQCLTTVLAEPLEKNDGYLQSIMPAQIRQSNDLLRIAYCRRSELRLLQFICWLADMFGEPTDEGRRILIRLTHQEIAESISSTRVTVTRLLKALERDDKIRWAAQEKIIYNKTFEQL